MILRAFHLVSLLLASVLCGGLALPARAQDQGVPYWASIRAEEVNMRVGPGVSFPVEWVYRSPGLPLKVVRVMQGWRLVRDPDGSEGWVMGRLLSRERGAIVMGEGTAGLRDEPSAQGALKWQVEPGVIGRLGDCRAGWCAFDVEGRAGWIEEDRLWGAGEP